MLFNCIIFAYHAFELDKDSANKKAISFWSTGEEGFQNKIRYFPTIGVQLWDVNTLSGATE